MSEQFERAAQDRRRSCTCGTGIYCKRHLAYGLSDTQLDRAERERKVLDADAQRIGCGGGRRVMAKKVEVA
jgi:hypothetical protein